MPSARVFRIMGATAAVWLSIGLLSATQFYASWMTTERRIDISYGRLVLWQVALWLLWGLLTPVVVALARYQPIRPIARVVAFHLAAGVAIAVVRLVLVEMVSAALAPFPPGALRFDERVVRRILTSLQVELLVYWGLLWATQSIDSYRRLRERDRVTTGLRAELAEARLSSLRLQMQPHFLFNTLHTIGGLAREGDVEGAVDTLERLSGLLRCSLDSTGCQKVPLRDELAVVRMYADIQRRRFDDRLTIEIDVDGDVVSALVPSLILQPLVENAISHGIAHLATPGRVIVRAAIAGNRVAIEVLDNGRGFSQAASDRRSIGLANTRQRLQLLYGSAYEFSLTNRPEAGAHVKLVLPLEWSAAT